MHDDELTIDDALVRRLLSAQFPEWADLPVRRFASNGTVNALYRLGSSMLVRLPLLEQWGGTEVVAEDVWLRRLAGHLSVRTPRLLGAGCATAEYPCTWSVLEWLDGVNPVPGEVEDTERLADDLASFVTQLHAIDHSGWDGVGLDTSLMGADADARYWIAQLSGLAEVDAVTAAWESAISAPAWAGRRVVLHSDLLPGNLLMLNGRLSAVIDWSRYIGDPARDLIVAWYLLPRVDRDRFRSAVAADDATWARSRGMALLKGVAALPYYRETNPTMADNARRVIGAILDDHAGG